MRPLYALIILVLAGCDRSTPDVHSALQEKPVVNVASSLGQDKEPATSASVREAANAAGFTLIIARDTCGVSRADFEKLANSIHAGVTRNTDLKLAFVQGAKEASMLRAEAVNKGELNALKAKACPRVSRVLATIQDRKPKSQ